MAYAYEDAEVGLGSSELVILMWQTKNVAAAGFPSTMAMIVSVFNDFRLLD